MPAEFVLNFFVLSLTALQNNTVENSRVSKRLFEIESSFSQNCEKRERKARELGGNYHLTSL